MGPRVKALRYLGRALRLRCPVCGKSQVFIHKPELIN